MGGAESSNLVLMSACFNEVSTMLLGFRIVRSKLRGCTVVRPGVAVASGLFGSGINCSVCRIEDCSAAGVHSASSSVRISALGFLMAGVMSLSVILMLSYGM